METVLCVAVGCLCLTLLLQKSFIKAQKKLIEAQKKLIDAQKKRLDSEAEYNKTVTLALFRIMGVEIRQVKKCQGENQEGESKGRGYGERFSDN